MLTLHPQNSFTVVRQIANHTDTATYYVRAVIRNAYTDAIIETLDLTDRGSQRFSKNWQVPADPSGQGFYISIVTSVYADSGYTTKSENYGDEENTYLVQDRLTGMHRGGGGGVDAYTIRRIVQEELEKLPKPQPFPTIPTPPQMPPMRFDEVLAAIRAIPKATAAEHKPVDLTPVLSAVEATRKAVEAKEVTPPTDLTPVLERLKDDKEETVSKHETVRTVVEKIDKQTPELIKKAIREEFAGMKILGEFTNTGTPTTPKKPASPKPKPAPLPAIDVKRLAL